MRTVSCSVHLRLFVPQYPLCLTHSSSSPFVFGIYECEGVPALGGNRRVWGCGKQGGMRGRLSHCCPPPPQTNKAWAKGDVWGAGATSRCAFLLGSWPSGWAGALMWLPW